jgi:hypothetical protein
MKAIKNTYEVKVEDTTITYQSAKSYRHVAVIKWADGAYEIVGKSNATRGAFWNWRAKLHDNYERAHGNQVFIRSPRLVADINAYMNELSDAYLRLKFAVQSEKHYDDALQTIVEIRNLLQDLRYEVKARIPQEQAQQVA